MTPTIARCHWCGQDRAVSSDGFLLRHRKTRKGNPCKGSGRHKHTKPRPKNSESTTND